MHSTEFFWTGKIKLSGQRIELRWRPTRALPYAVARAEGYVTTFNPLLSVSSPGNGSKAINSIFLLDELSFG